MRSIPLHLFKSLLVVSRCPTLSVAARDLNLTQSGLTKQMQALEELLPHAVFTERGRTKKLTTFGHELVAQIKAKFDGLDTVVEHTCARFSNEEEATVRLCGRKSVLDRLMLDLKFKGKVVFIESRNSEIIGSLLRQDADFGITFFETDSADVIAKSIYKERFKLVIPKSLLKDKPKSTKDAFDMVQDKPFIEFQEHDPISREIFAHYLGAVFVPRTKRVISDYYSLVAMAESGVGAVIVPHHLPADSRTVWSFEISNRAHADRQFYLYYRKDLITAHWFEAIKKQILASYT
jgi:LysR family transcriptional activator of glutamate synthase operon